MSKNRPAAPEGIGIEITIVVPLLTAKGASTLIHYEGGAER